MKYYIVLSLCALLSGCAGGDEGKIDRMVGDLASALNHHDTAAAGSLYDHGSLLPLNDDGDSSVVYRMLHIPGGSGFEASNIKSVVVGDHARTDFDLGGKVSHKDSVSGVMSVHVKIQAVRRGGEWKFNAGSERQGM
ncbi:MAG: hypothetical protein ABIR47_03915 [Candidatus Kapaibacterium sp.]